MALSTLITARSLVSERPTIVALPVLPLSNVTVISPCWAAASTTWLLVRMWPLLSSTTPLPMSPLWPDWTVIVTSDGSILAAAAETVPSSFGLLAAGTVVTLIGEVVPPSTR